MIAEPRSPSTLSILREARELVARDRGIRIALVAATARVLGPAASDDAFLSAARTALDELRLEGGKRTLKGLEGLRKGEQLAAFDAAIALLDTPHAR